MDVFVVKYDSGGNVTWAKGFGGGSNDEAYSISTDALQNIYVTGYFNQTVSFGSTPLTTSGQADIFLVKLDTTGNVVWARKAGGNNDDRGKSVFTDAAGNSYIAGFFTSTTIAFGSTVLLSGSPDNSFVAKYDSSGNFIRVSQIGSDSRANGVTIVGDNIYVCGTFTADTLYFGSHALPIEGNNDFYVANFDTAGNTDWAIKQTSGGTSNEAALAMAADPSGNIYIAGDFDSDPILEANELEPNEHKDRTSKQESMERWTASRYRPTRGGMAELKRQFNTESIDDLFVRLARSAP